MREVMFIHFIRRDMKAGHQQNADNLNI